MRRVAFGGTGLEVSPVGLGAWAIGGPWQRGWGEQDDRDSVATIVAAVERGVNWIDTAAVYGLGHAEEVIGQAVAGLPEDERPLVFTKCGRVPDQPGRTGKIGTPEHVRESTESSLRRLGVEALDMLQMHWPPEDGTPPEETWETIAEMKRSGKVRMIGACNCGTDLLDLFQAIEPIDCVQPPLSLIRRESLEDVLPWAQRRGAAAIVYSPMQSGLLTGSFSAERVVALDPGDWRREDPEFNGERLERNLGLVDGLRATAERLGCTVPELAIAWDLAQPQVTGAIVGARRPEQLDGWVGAAEVELSPSDLDEIASLLLDSGAGGGPVRG